MEIRCNSGHMGLAPYYFKAFVELIGYVVLCHQKFQVFQPVAELNQIKSHE